MTYLDYAATTPLSEETLEVMLPYLREDFGNPDSLHSLGQKAAFAVERAREKVADAVGVRPSEVYFTSGGTEANNWAVRRLGRGGVCVSAIEHPASMEAARYRENATVARSDENGIVTAQAVEAAMTENTGLVAVMCVNNETGCIQPVREISVVCARKKALLFCDCIQAANEIDLRPYAYYCDAISLSGHKIYGPKGTGALIVKGKELKPLIVGGEQERRLRGGTLNVAGIVGFSEALVRAQRGREAYVKEVKTLRDAFVKTILSGLDGLVTIDGTEGIAGIVHMTFPVENGKLLAALDMAGIAASGGAACSAHSGKPSHVMLAMGRSEDEARRGIRFSFGKGAERKEITAAAKTVVKCVKKLTV